MAKTSTVINQEISTIRFETGDRANTAERVGMTLKDMFDYTLQVESQIGEGNSGGSSSGSEFTSTTLWNLLSANTTEKNNISHLPQFHVKLNGTTYDSANGTVDLGTVGGSEESPDSVSWNDVTGKPTWIGSSKPSYSWSEITSKSTWIGSSKPSYSWSEITNKPSWIGSSAPTISWSDITGTVPTWNQSTTGNAATATKLATSRIFWGQSYDGSGNVSGDMSNVGRILPSDDTKDIGSNDHPWRYIYAEWFGSKTGKDLRFASNDGHTDMKIDANNHYVGIGIGDASPSERLTVEGNVLASAFYQSSDIALKENIQPVSDIDKADDVSFKEFVFKVDSSRKVYGVIAQDVEAAGLGNLVRKGDYKSVDYISLLCLKVASLEKKISELQTRKDLT